MSVAKSSHEHGALTAEAVASASSRTRTSKPRKAKEQRSRNLMQRVQRLWKESLQFRALGTAGIMMFLSFLMVGWSLSSQIATSLFENQKLRRWRNRRVVSAMFRACWTPLRLVVIAKFAVT